MGLAVIGAGFGRTGTESMKFALEMLGFGPCHHMHEIEPGSELSRFWRDAVTNESPDWETGLAGYGSTVDWPSAYWWRELSEFYPDAKVILTWRDAQSWYKSFSHTIQQVIQRTEDPDSLGRALIERRIFGGRLSDAEHVIAVYEQNIQDVQETIDADRLLIYSLGAGWEPLCRFLDVPVPDVPFPNSNNARDFFDRIRREKAKRQDVT